MRKFFIFIIISLFISACTLKKVSKHHGVKSLENKEKKLTLLKSNKNDIIKLLGHPSTESTFDNNIWIYIENKTTTGSLMVLGKKETSINNVLLLEINHQGLLVKKQIKNINQMKNISFDKNETYIQYSKKTFIYDFLSSMRQKINDPLGKRKR